MERIAAEAVGGFPADGGIYAVTFRIDGVDQDTSFLCVAVGSTTESDAAGSARRTADSWEARWSYAYFPESGLEGVRVIGLDQEGVGSHRREAESLGLWFEGDDGADDQGERLADRFHEMCVGAARRLHGSERIVESLGRPVLVILYDLFDPDAMSALTRAPIRRARSRSPWPGSGPGRGARSPWPECRSERRTAKPRRSHGPSGDGPDALRAESGGVSGARGGR
ncbi:hypothetical protein [Streptomyces sp. NPDC056796]|uniref:hypothetical protein n=1 Tax=Streptomyces sp. NPDC056796 TaxID=3345947 RepID=UPI003674091D